MAQEGQNMEEIIHTQFGNSS